MFLFPWSIWIQMHHLVWRSQVEWFEFESPNGGIFYLAWLLIKNLFDIMRTFAAQWITCQTLVFMASFPFPRKRSLKGKGVPLKTLGLAQTWSWNQIKNGQSGRSCSQQPKAGARNIFLQRICTLKFSQSIPNHRKLKMNWVLKFALVAMVLSSAVAIPEHKSTSKPASTLRPLISLYQ